jgi:hypothetical protein
MYKTVKHTRLYDIANVISFFPVNATQILYIYQELCIKYEHYSLQGCDI